MFTLGNNAYMAADIQFLCFICVSFSWLDDGQINLGLGGCVVECM